MWYELLEVHTVSQGIATLDAALCVFNKRVVIEEAMLVFL